MKMSFLHYEEVSRSTAGMLAFKTSRDHFRLGLTLINPSFISRSETRSWDKFEKTEPRGCHDNVTWKQAVLSQPRFINNNFHFFPKTSVHTIASKQTVLGPKFKPDIGVVLHTSVVSLRILRVQNDIPVTPPGLEPGRPEHRQMLTHQSYFGLTSLSNTIFTKIICGSTLSQATSPLCKGPLPTVFPWILTKNICV